MDPNQDPSKTPISFVVSIDYVESGSGPAWLQIHSAVPYTGVPCTLRRADSRSTDLLRRSTPSKAMLHRSKVIALYGGRQA